MPPQHPPLLLGLCSGPSDPLSHFCTVGCPKLSFRAEVPRRFSQTSKELPLKTGFPFSRRPVFVTSSSTFSSQVLGKQCQQVLHKEGPWLWPGELSHSLGIVQPALLASPAGVGVSAGCCVPKSPDMGANWAFWTVTSKFAPSSANEEVHFPWTSIGIYPKSAEWVGEKMHRDVVSRLNKLLAVGRSATLCLFLNIYFFLRILSALFY